ncbi:acyl-CoA carboxylase subunit epsilon [Streptomyces sp. TRM43335]|uniref:Acyl-CoA carboxylase subunit epsilon n=1 Tax=Streptomyces taklimakanensis TaxID=2569853 RepID=A0A6G2BFZ9_9ACTN|nr:acyl-CoA carboxylase subunit epsilon [Streptomyces taklimakanensis]
MRGATDPAPLVRVERGRADAAELAALTAVLLARAAARARPDAAPRHRRATAGWRRPERIPGHPDPRGWRTGAPAVRTDTEDSTG